MKEKNSLLSNEERTAYRCAAGKNSARTQCKIQTSNSGRRTDVNKIIKNVNNSKNPINFSQLNLSNIKLELFTDASFNNLSNGGSQAGQIIF